MKENKKNYCTPLLEVLNARVEKGFEVSPDNPTTDPVDPNEDGGFNAGGNTDWTGGSTEGWFN